MTMAVDKRKGATLVAVAAMLTALCFLLLAGTSPRQASALGTTCDHADSLVDEATAKQLRKALACLIHKKRAQRDRRRLRANDDLNTLVRKHNRLMIEEDCFRHTCPGERSLRRRLERSGYLDAGDRYGYGQNIGCAITPQAQLNEWLAHDFHRRNILGKRFRHFGIAANKGAPRPPSRPCDPEGERATYTVLFAWRKR